MKFWFWVSIPADLYLWQVIDLPLLLLSLLVSFPFVILEEK